MSHRIATTLIISTIFTLFIFIATVFSLSAQNKSADEKVLIGGKKYTLYTVVSGDSPFSIARKFGITLDELNDANPGIRNQLNSGQTIKILIVENQGKPLIQNGLLKDDNEDNLFSYHSVRKRETIFSIAQKNNVTSEDIYNYNPQLREGIKVGDVLKIPKPKTSANESKVLNKEFQQSVKHVVGRRETLYSIAQRYNTTQEEILKLNPSIKGVLSKGTVLIIPKSSGLNFDQSKLEEATPFSEYTIVNGDNFYQIEKRFGISKNELEQLNPTLKNGLNIGMIIKIPLKESARIWSNITTDSLSAKKNAEANNPLINSEVISDANLNKTFEIGVFLPFCQNLSDSAHITRRTNSFLEFYSGVLLAAEKMSEAGMKLKLYVYDTYQDSKEVGKIVKKPEFLSLDLIIGPVFPENQKIVAELSAKNHIPMVSPLSSDSRFVATTPEYYQINPEKKIRLASTADYIVGKFEYQNIIMLNQGANSGDEKFILERLNQKLGEGNVSLYNIWAQDVVGLEGMLKADEENIIILIEGNEANVSLALTRLNTISKTNNITVIGLQEYVKMQSIDIEYLHNIRLHYLVPYFIDYRNSGVKTFLTKYRLEYGNEPTQYSFQGYDIALHFTASLGNSGKNFPAANTSPGVELLQADYNFQKISEFGGYMNRTLYIIEYTDNFEVRSDGKILGEISTESGLGN